MNQKSVKYEADCCPLGHIDIEIYVTCQNIVSVYRLGQPVMQRELQRWKEWKRWGFGRTHRRFVVMNLHKDTKRHTVPPSWK